jgi:hypothetical protein
MFDVGFRDLVDSANDIADKQVFRHTFFFSGSVAVPNRALGNPGRAKITVVADQDADILITGINGTVIAPATAAGRRSDAAATIFPFGNTAAGVAIPGFASDGLEVDIYSGSEKSDKLTDLPGDNIINTVALGVIAQPTRLKVRDLLNPGYFPGRYTRPAPFRRYLRKSDKLVFEFFNNDTTEGGLFHFVSILLTCRKYEAVTR